MLSSVPRICSHVERSEARSDMSYLFEPHDSMCLVVLELSPLIQLHEVYWQICLMQPFRHAATEHRSDLPSGRGLIKCLPAQEASLQCLLTAVCLVYL